MTSATDEGPRTVVRLHLNHFFPTNPSSPPLPTETILLHGLGVSGAVWAGFARRFLARPVIAPDLRGHGASDPAPLPHQYTPTDYAADVLALLDASGMGEPGTVIGHSLGSLIALAMAKAEASRIKRLILIDPPLDPTISSDVVGEVARLRTVPPGPLEDYLATFHGEVAARSLARLFRCAAPG
ncbi:MAG: alpha/beta fold hydrolase, partial [Chloroflexi bacterium]|nr:alpha/beta fold hydrolase [Chloroflexota bacterium]